MLNKKGDVTDGIIILIIIFFLVISFIVVGFITGKFKHIVQDTVLNQSQVAESVVGGLDNISHNLIDKGFIMIFGFLVLGTMVSSFLVRVHPGFVFLYIIFAGFTVFIAIFLTNAYEKFASVDLLAEVVAEQPMSAWVMQHAVKVMIGVMAISMIILFAKPGGDSI